MPSSTKNHPTRTPLKSGVFEIFFLLFFLAMTKVVNSFALLGDEEEDDVTVLVEHFAKKVEVTATVAPAKSKKKPSQKQAQQVSSENGEKGKGREGQIQGSGRDGGAGKNGKQFGNGQENGYRGKYTEGSNWNGYDNAHHRGRGRGRGGNRGRGRGRDNNNNGNVIVDQKEGNRKTAENDSDGWHHVGHAHVRGNVNKTNNNWSEERPFRNENRNYGDETRGYRGGYHQYGGRRHDGVDNASEQSNNNEVKENVDRADAFVNVESNVAISEGDAAPATVEPTEVRSEEKTPEGSVKSEGRVKADKPFKKFEKEDENLMTLEEYQKVFAEKRKALEALKNEERKVAADNDFEAMEMVAKKKEEALIKPETAKLKKKDSLEKDEKSRKTLSINEFLKPADGEKFFYRRPGRGLGNQGVSGDFRNQDRSQQGGFRNQDRSQQGGFRNQDRSQQGGFRNQDRSQQGGFRNQDRSQQGGFRNQDRSQQGGFKNQDRSQQGGFRNQDRSQQGGFSNVNRAEQGEFKSKVSAEQGEFKNKDHAEQGGFKNKVYPREGGKSEDKPVIQIEDQSQFPVLKGTAPAV